MNQAKVRSIDALQHWRSSLVVYHSKARRGLAQVTEEVKRMRHWLESEQMPFWKAQIRRLTRKMEQAQQELISARFSTLRATLTVHEQAVRKAKAAVQYAEEKLARTKIWCRNYDRVVEPLVRRLEGMQYFTEHEMPKAITLMEQLLRGLEGYAATTLTDPNASGAPATDASTEAPSSVPPQP